MCIEYWKNETGRIEYFQHQLMFKALVHNNLTAKKLFAKMPHITEDESLHLVGNNLFNTFDIDEWEKIKTASFFQKTAYKKNRRIANPADYPNTYFSTLYKNIL